MSNLSATYTSINNSVLEHMRYQSWILIALQYTTYHPDKLYFNFLTVLKSFTATTVHLSRIQPTRLAVTVLTKTSATYGLGASPTIATASSSGPTSGLIEVGKFSKSSTIKRASVFCHWNATVATVGAAVSSVFNGNVYALLK